MASKQTVQQEDDPLAEVDAGPLVGDAPDAPGALDDAPSELDGAVSFDDESAGLLDDTNADVDVPHALMTSAERGLLDGSDEPTGEDAVRGVDLGNERAESTVVDDGEEGVDESFVVDETRASDLDREVDEGFEDTRFASPLQRDERRRADRAFVRVALDEHAEFEGGPAVTSPPRGCTASVVLHGVELLALHEPGLTMLARRREGIIEILADLGEPEDDPGPVESVRARLHQGALEVLVEGPFGAWVYAERTA